MSEKIKTAVMEVIKAHMDGEDKNTKAVLSDVMQSVNELEILEQEPNIDMESEEIKILQKRSYLEGFHEALKQKSGKWFIDERPESDREVICSNCDQPIFKYHKLDFDYRPKYCPNCGAKMESEDKE